ncbi:hypothetical protein L9F63_011406, partial [Diploptera punctata]
ENIRYRMETVLKNVIEGDRHLLKYQTHEEYLDSLVQPIDLFYLRSTTVARQIAELGYRSTGETLNKEQFLFRHYNVKETFFPSRKPHRLASANQKPFEPLLQDLATRERANRVGLLATIIFLRNFTKKGVELSGYIDFAQRLKREDWVPIFEEKRRIKPKLTDLGYYNWKTGESACNSSDTYKAILDPKYGLLFQCRNDRKVVCVDPRVPSPGSNTTRTTIKSDTYEQV